MNPAILARILENLESPHWSSRIIEGEGRIVRWLPVWKLTDPHTGAVHCYGLTGTGKWGAELPDKRRAARNGDFRPFLPILENTRKLMVAELSKAIAAKGLPAACIRTFPFDSVMEFALSQRGYWFSCAEKWLEHGYPLSPAIALAIPEHRLVSQWYRQRIDEIVYE